MIVTAITIRNLGLHRRFKDIVARSKVAIRLSRNKNDFYIGQQTYVTAQFMRPYRSYWISANRVELKSVVFSYVFSAYRCHAW